DGTPVEGTKSTGPAPIEPVKATAPVTVAETSARPADNDLGTQAKAVLTRYCFRCHGQDGSEEGGRNYIVNLDQLVKRKKVGPGDPKTSKLLKKIRVGEMPPEEEKLRPGDADVQVLERWIAAGAPAPGAAVETARPEVAKEPIPMAKGRPFVDEREVLT